MQNFSFLTELCPSTRSKTAESLVSTKPFLVFTRSSGFGFHDFAFNSADLIANAASCMFAYNHLTA